MKKFLNILILLILLVGYNINANENNIGEPVMENKDCHCLLMFLVGVLLGSGIASLYHKSLNKKNHKDGQETKISREEEEITFSEFKEHLKNKLTKEDIIKKGQNPKDVFSTGIEEFAIKALSILDDSNLTSVEKKIKLLELYKNPTKYLEKRKKVEHINFDKKFNKLIDFEGVPGYIEIELREFNIPKERAEKDLVSTTKEILIKRYDKGINHIKKSISKYIETLENYTDTEKIAEKLEKIKKELLFELKNIG